MEKKLYSEKVVKPESVSFIIGKNGCHIKDITGKVRNGAYIEYKTESHKFLVSAYSKESVQQLIDELKKFNTEFNNVSISDDYLKSEVWCIDESRNDAMDPHDIRNSLEHNYIENTARYKILQKMKEEEHVYFEEHGITLGDLRKYRMIQLDRARQEIDLMNEIYKDEMLKEELENKLLNKNTDNFDSNLSHIKFIDEANMLDI